MSVRTVSVVALAIICGISAAVGMSRLRTDSPQPSPQATSPVVVARNEIARTRKVTLDDLEIKQLPKELAPPGALAEIELAADRVAMARVLPGEAVLEAKLAPKGTSGGLAAVIPQGMRAYAIPTSRVAAGVAGFILPGNKVDVLLNLKSSGRNDETGGGLTTTLLQSVEVLAVDQRLDAPAENKVNPRELSSVTLLVTPEQAQMLDLGQNAGQLTLSLRNPEDSSEDRTEPAILADVRFFHGRLGVAAAEAIAAARTHPTQSTESKLAVHSRTAAEGYDIAVLRGNHWGRVRVASMR